MRLTIFLLLLTPLLAAAQEPGAAKPNPAMQPVTDQPGLPRVLLIGDSISLGYTLPVRKLLQGKANVHRALTNTGPTTKGVEGVDEWLGTARWDVIHFNFGLHDLKFMENNKQQVSLADYEANLEKIVSRLEKTKARLIFATTTPVPRSDKLSPKRIPEDVVAYNKVALKVAKAHHIRIDDLYGFALPRLTRIQLPANVHFTPAGYDILASRVVASITKALPRR
ncbi:MAG: SGNH/GDSL hydrolase family protein [Acidobacteria bacterium]|nr:SGNH/GDSL hydrolase family protein [Acidobacteriota bacterium]